MYLKKIYMYCIIIIMRSIIIDIDTKSRYILLANLKEYPIILVSKLKSIKYSNVTLLSNSKLSKFLTSANCDDVNIIITNSLKNQSKYEKYINKLNYDIYLFTTIDHIIITNPLCKYIPNIKLANVLRCIHAMYDITASVLSSVQTRADVILSEDEYKRKFRELCVDLLPSIQTQPIPENISRTTLSKEAVFIEYRTLPHIETIVRNAVIKLGDEWCFTIVCGVHNYEFIQNIVKRIHPNIRIIETPYTNLSQNNYNNMLSSKSFWNMLCGEKILIYQEDTFIFKTNIEDFIQWDYIGAPFSKPCVEPINVGNGGLSLRTKSVMLHVIEQHPIASVPVDIMTKQVKHYVEKTKLENIPEDVYFSYCIQKYELGKVADFETAKQFSMETVYSENPFGMHCMWHSDKNWEKRFIEYIYNTTNIQTITINTPVPDTVVIYDDLYLNKLSEYATLYNIDTSLIMSDPKQEYRYFCYNYLDYIRMLQLPTITQSLYYEAVLIEFRCLPHLEFILRNNIYKLGDTWSHTIICGNLNYDYMYDIIKRIDRDIKLIQLTEVDNMTQSEYSNLLMTSDFWNLCVGEKILIYQEDSCIFKSNIANFLEYDYIGAPWPLSYEINRHSVGNGGFSLRSKSVMLECCNYINEPLQLSKVVQEYMAKNALPNCPEDVYFTTVMETYNIGIIANYEVATQFSVESILNYDAFGGHQFWLNNPEWKKYMYDNIILQFRPTYTTHIEHRGGWATFINSMNAMQLYNIHSNITLYDIVETHFIWNPQITQTPWCGIIHCTENTPEYLTCINIRQLFKPNSLFLQNIYNCLFIIVLAPNIYKFIKHRCKQLNIQLNVHLMRHPIEYAEEDVPKFTVEKFNNNANKTIIQIGQQLRNVTSIYAVTLPEPFTKLWLTGTRDFNRVQWLFDKEQFYKKTAFCIEDVPLKYTDTFAEYDELLSQNIVFLDLYDAAANNVVLECIMRGTPLLINKIPGIVYYLGENYPMYYKDIHHIDHLLTEENIINTHLYLQTIPLTNNKYFITNIINQLHKTTKK